MADGTATMGAPTLTDFLDQSKQALAEARSKKQQLTIVLGNDQPDLDSIASAIVLAYFRTIVPPENAWSKNYVPVLHESRTAFQDHTLLKRVLNATAIELEHLIALEDMVVGDTRSSGLHEDDTRFIFVDHNLTLGREKQNYSNIVIGCIDHHHDMEYVPKDTQPEPRIIMPAGSCTSLVVNYCRQYWETLDFPTPGSEVTLAKLALAAILVDTKDLERGVTKEDLDAVEFLLSRIKFSEGGQKDFDRTDYYYEIIGEERPRPQVEEVKEPEVIPNPDIPPPVERAITPEAVVVEEPVVEPVQSVVEPEPEVIPEPEPVIEEPQPEPEPEPVIEMEEEPIVEPVPEPIPEPEAEPVKPVIAVVTQPEPPAAEPIPERPKTPEPKTPTQATSPLSPTTPRTPFPRVYLDEILDHDFERTYEGGGAIGITFTKMPLAAMVKHAERDLIERAIEDAAAGSPTSDEVISGTPFTAAVREFALEKGLAVYAIRTDTRKGNELFIWVFAPSMAYYIPRFVQNRAQQLKLERHTDGITKEWDDGMIGAYWIRADAGREEVKKAVMEGTTYIFFGSAPNSPQPRAEGGRRSFFRSSTMPLERVGEKLERIGMANGNGNGSPTSPSKAPAVHVETLAASGGV